MDTLPPNTATLDLVKEAARCGGVVAALLTRLRRMKAGDTVAIINIGEYQASLNEALSILESYGLLRVIDRSPSGVIISKVR